MPKRLREVAPGLYQAGEAQAKNVDVLRAHGITHVLSIGARGPAAAGFVCKRIGLAHRDDADLLGSLWEALAFIGEAVGGIPPGRWAAVRHALHAVDPPPPPPARPARVLVHCKAGICRSVAAAAAFLIAADPALALTPDAAVALIAGHTGRSCVIGRQPEAFRQQLGAFRGALRAYESLDDSLP